ncbi:hypothetical protein [Gloeobacter kilaueensis]|uniref:Uncharacterized protein n=1 Tax=Gloeobacter kilaueensis (strain ATCC BAA-2537 / CCAP 1431/1 / ULC 316 / JS1) TaxID=1183438 RepID=U5QPZ7_GLOK1|nr:hypothetical protein [Gloeobacter kilaueensis]AGY59704.1 hypothetical protein GKIL_3458 [Gloeobacter kilaueensis JS1]
MQDSFVSVEPVIECGPADLDLDFKVFFIELVERSYRQGHPLDRIIADIQTACCQLGVPGLDELRFVQWAEQTFEQLEKQQSQPQSALNVCHLCGKIAPYRESNCASFCPYSS